MAGPEAEAVDKYIKERKVEQVVTEIVQSLLEGKPDNPRQWLLDKIERELHDETEDLSEVDLRRLFAVTRKITSEIVPQETIDIVISETLQLLHCDRVSLFVLDRKSGQLRLYASNLETPIVVSPGQGIAGSVFNTKESVNIPDCYKDHRFDKSFDQKSGYSTRSLLAAPIVDYEGKAVGVLQAINKLPHGETDDIGIAGNRAIPFRRNDVKMLAHLTQHVAIALRNAEVYREAIAASERSTALLNTIQSLSQDLGIQSMLLTITMHANKIVSAQRSTVFILDETHGELWSVSTDTGQEIRIPRKAGIAGLCCTEAKVINIPDAYADSRFNQEVDKKTGFKTHSILALPMFSPEGVLGVIQMINKVSFDGQFESFDDSDIEVMELFAKFVGPKLANSSMLSRRQNELDLPEGELALGEMLKTPSNQKRHSHVALQALGEEEENEEAGD